MSVVANERIDFHQLAKPANLKNSAVLRMLEEEENRKRNGHPGAKQVIWPPPPDSEEYNNALVEEAPVYSQGGPQYHNQQSSPVQQQQRNQVVSPNFQQQQSHPQQPLSPQQFSGPQQQQQPRGWAPVPSPVAASQSPQFNKPPQQQQQQQQQQQPLVQPLQAQNWNMPIPQQPQINAMKNQVQVQVQGPVGRPIVKGNNYPYMQQQDYQQQMQMQHQRNMYQQQRVKIPQQQQQQAPQYNMQNRGVGLMPQQIGMNLQQLQQQNRNRLPWMSSQPYGDRGMPITGRGMQLGGRGSPNDGGDLSPTSDQLARWFSPELLARAREGKLPDMPNVSLPQNALSLEEVERLQQNTAPVHN